MKLLYDKIVNFGNSVGEKHFGSPKGEILLKRFADSLELPKGSYIKLNTDMGYESKMVPSKMRKILITGIPLFTKRGKVGKIEVAIGLINWRIFRK
ncbi:MAG: hypothetical protein ABIL44_07825 [candidate division WOR-3 bacterium]